MLNSAEKVLIVSRTGPEVKAIFIGALDRQPGGDREAYLDITCAGDAELRRRLDALLRAHEQASEVFGEAEPEGADEAATLPPAADEAATLPATVATAIGTGPVPATARDTQFRDDASAIRTSSTHPLDATVAGGDGPNGDALARGTIIRYFGDYEIQAELGKGGVGVVYQARQVSLNRPVALKMLRAGILAGDDELRRFQNEAEAVALLDHPGIVSVYEVGEYEGQRYLSMKLVRGGNLSEGLAAYQDDPRATATLVQQIAEAVHHAHMRGILHRDLKPANVLLDAQGYPHVTDFGLAKRVQADFELTLTGAILGTPGYMSPEQAVGRRGTITTATDVYGLGSVLYYMLTGKAPFAGDSILDTIQRVREQPPEPPRRQNGMLPRDLEVICLKCLEKEPGRRYSSAQALADDLRAWLESRPIAARPVGSLTRARLWCKRRPAVAGLTAATIAVALAGMAFGTWQWSAAIRNARSADANAAKAIENERQARASARQAQNRSVELAASNQALRRTTYASVMRLAQGEWDRGSVSSARTLMDSLRPRPAEDDLRSFDWSFLQRQCGASLLTVPVPGRPPNNPQRSVSFSPDGRRLVVTSWDNLAIADAATGREVYRDTSGPYLDAAFSPCGRFLAVLTYATKERLDPESWTEAATKLSIIDPKSYKVLRTFEGPTGYRGSLAFSPNGSLLALKLSRSGAKDWESTLALADVTSGASMRTLHDGKGIDTPPVFSPDGKLLATETRYNAISLWDAATGRPARTIVDSTAGFVRSLSFSADSRRLASIGDDGRAKIWDVATARPVLTLRVADQNGRAVSYSPDGLRLVTADSEGIARAWDAETGELLFLIRGVSGNLVHAPDRLRLAAYGEGNALRLWDATGETLSAVVGPLDGPIYNLAISPDGEMMATGDGAVWDTKSLARRYRVEAPADFFWGSVAFSPDGRRLALGGGKLVALGAETGPGTVRVVEASSGRELLSFPEPLDIPGGLNFSPDGRRLVTSSGVRFKKLGWATLRDGESGQPLRQLDGYVEGRDNVAFRPDSKALAYGGANAILVRGTGNGEELLTLKDLGGKPQSIGYSPDGQRLVALIRSLDESEVIKIWDARDGRTELVISIQRGDTFNRVIFSPDGKRLATADFRALVRIWDASNGQELLTLKGHRSWVWSLAFSPDGTRLYSGSRDRTVRIWRADATTAGSGPEPPGLSFDPARLFTQAITLGQGGRYDKAELLWRRFLEIGRQRRLDDELTTFSAQSLLGDCLSHLGRHHEAESLLLHSYQQALAIPSTALEPNLLAEFRDRIVAHYEAAGQPEQAALWRARELDARFPTEVFAN